MLVKDAMSRDVVTASPETSVRDAAKMLADNHIGSLVIVKNDAVIGMATERDILCSMAESENHDIGSKKVKDVMTNYIISISSDSTIQKAAKLMAENKIKKLPVIDMDRLVGIITASDIIIAQPGMIKDMKALLSRRLARRA